MLVAAMFVSIQPEDTFRQKSAWRAVDKDSDSYTHVSIYVYAQWTKNKGSREDEDQRKGLRRSGRLAASADSST